MPNEPQVDRNPYHREGQPPKILRSVVIYVDVLGYLDMAKKAEHENEQDAFLAKLHEALQEHGKWLRREGSYHSPFLVREPYALKAFTDNIVIGWPIRDNAESELYGSWDIISDFQIRMANAGFFVRGAISLGDAYVDEIAVFGSGFTEAHDAEARLARDPRVILTTSAVNAVRHHMTSYYMPSPPPQSNYLFRDADGQWFVNYLQAILMAVDEAGPFYEELLKHKQMVECRLREFQSEPKIWSKYAWVANYHNYFCDQYPEHFDGSHKIDLGIYQLRPSRIVEDSA
jgi:hypothetical protein